MTENAELLRNYRVDKTGWPEGPWMTEPDRVQWRTEAGLPGLVVRNHHGALCGYAAVPPGHPLHGKDYDSVDMDVHGGLTYADLCMEDGGGVCHIPEPGEPAEVWWFGFDCGHSFDFIPRFHRLREDMEPELLSRLESRETYRDLAYVRAEVESLARQLSHASQDTPVTTVL